MATQLGQYDFK